MYENLIDTHINSAPQYMPDYYPEINESGTITGIVRANQIPEGAVLVWWTVDHAEKTDGVHGFDAILV